MIMCMTIHKSMVSVISHVMYLLLNMLITKNYKLITVLLFITSQNDMFLIGLITECLFIFWHTVIEK